MFTIYGGKSEFEQWDLDQLITCDCLKEGDDVVFSGHGKHYETTAFVQDGKVYADVPNFMLQTAGTFRVDLGWGLNCHMDCRTTFNVAAKEKPNGYKCDVNIKNRGGNSGGVSSWNDLTDKPFGELPTGGDTLTWTAFTEDQVDESLIVADMFYRVSDAIVTMDDLSQGGMLTIDNAVGVFTAETCFELFPGVVLFGDGFLSVAEDNTQVIEGDQSFTFSKAGLYVFAPNMLVDLSLTINGYTGFPTTKKIDAKYLPDSLGKVLYTNDGKDGCYLYKDIELTEKCTIADIPDSVDFSICVAIDGIPLMYLRPTLVGSRLYNQSTGYGIVQTMVADNFVRLYTAEYTPTT